ncbi:MAG TPA: N-acetylmuramoyl-L-alanine amidase [Candidatus Limnocylindria bacterium]|jgi:N-acetyl-anhydromuramyl-L-alanine amidase AmpD|nr:N-acetylmuramoyl-L-alanine amidase [Candidatus Limnocylindria bacterium]
MTRWVLAIAMAVGFFFVAPTPALAAPPAEPPSWYPPLDWIPAARSNYDAGRSARVVAIVIHETDGSWMSAMNWFRNPRSRVSSHYLVRAWDGGIMQFVAESDTAYHARDANPWTIGIEHEFSLRYGIGHTDLQYRSSAALVCAIAKRYGIPLDRNHIVGHKELPGNNHGDPGPWWNWTYYMSLVRGCSVPAEPRYFPASPTAGLQPGDAGEEVALLQWSLVHLGFMTSEDIAGGAGNFGPVTEQAVSSYQQAWGLPVTGTYGDITAAMLAKSLEVDLAKQPGLVLEPGAESDDVTLLQSNLQEIGYMDMVTGYYGPITYDAVARFQSDNGIAPSGVYDAVTRVALSYHTRDDRGVPTQLLGAVGMTFLIP